MLVSSSVVVYVGATHVTRLTYWTNLKHDGMRSLAEKKLYADILIAERFKQFINLFIYLLIIFLETLK